MSLFNKSSIKLNKEEVLFFKRLYQNDPSFDIRQRAHAVLLHADNYALKSISKILDLDDTDVSTIVNGWKHFGTEGVVNYSLPDLKSKILGLKESKDNRLGKVFDIVFKILSWVIIPMALFWIVIIGKIVTANFQSFDNKYIETPIVFFFLIILVSITIGFVDAKVQISHINWLKWVEPIRMVIQSFFDFIWRFWKWMLKKSLFLIFFIKKADLNKYLITLGSSAKNIVTIGKNANGNIVFQINNIVNVNGDFVKEQVEEEILSTYMGAKNKFLEIFNSAKDYNSNREDIAVFIYLRDKLNKIENKRKRDRYIYILATIAAIYFIHYSAIKAGFLIITITIPSMVCIFSGGGLVDPKLTQKDQLLKPNPLIEYVKSDSTKLNESKPKVDSSILALTDKKTNINEFFIEDEECPALSVIGIEQKRFIDNDLEHYFLKEYYISTPNDRYYLHVAAYWEIKEAAFQRKCLINNGYKKSKILKLTKNGKPLYAVTINDVPDHEILNFCQVKSDWDDQCYSEKYEAQLYHNK